MNGAHGHKRSRSHSSDRHSSRAQARTPHARRTRLPLGDTSRSDTFFQPATPASLDQARRHPHLAAGRLRWEAYFVIGVILALALIFFAGSIIAGIKARPALEGTGSVGIPQAQAASPEAAPTGSPLDGLLGRRNSDDRAAAFAVDPEKTDWNYDDNGRKTVYLTIDDGPSENTQEVLDILDRYGCKATFFVVGHNEEYFPLIAEAYKRGHTIGMHTYSHDYAEVYASPENYFADLDAISAVVKEQIGFVPCFIRFPGGSSNDVSADYCPGIMTELAAEVQQRGFQYWDWNLSVGDGSEHTAEEILGYGTEPLEAENIVLLCHDSATKDTTVEALPGIIEHYQQLGYSFEALDRNSWVCHHEILN